MDGQDSVSQMHTGEPERNVHSGSLTEVPQESYPLPLTWHTLVCTRESLKNVWDKLNQFPILFDDIWRGNFEEFLRDMFDPNSVILATGDYGICRICNIVPHRDAEVHLSFWDRRFKGRDKECVQAMRWMFYTLDLQRLSLAVPEMARSTINFILALGFKKEGIRRDYYAYKGKLLNVWEFGILRNEVFGEEKNG